MSLVFSVLSVGLIGGIFGIGLALASQAFSVKKDERLAELESYLPGLNCGACGYAGCQAYASALLNEDVSIELCKPGGETTLKNVASFLGKEIKEAAVKQVAQVMCRGNGGNAQLVYTKYNGLEDCLAAASLFGGMKECKFGCIGLGSCIKVCPVDAIYRKSDGNIYIDKNVCISCEKCVKICPTKVIKMVPENGAYMVACNSTDKGAAVRKYCKVGCIGCKICEKASPEGAFIVEDFLARIDYGRNGDRSEAAKKCPAKCIVKIVGDRIDDRE